jgi:multiple sugar transport system permease protein
MPLTILPILRGEETHLEEKNMSNETGLKKRGKWHLSDRGLVNLFIWPTLILLILVNIFPLFYSLYLSFTNYSVIANKLPVWIGIQNFTNHMQSQQVWNYFAITGKFTLISVLSQTLLGFGLAMLIREKFKGSGILTTLILIPMMLSPVVVGLFWKLMFNPGYGIFNYLISWTGLPLTTDWLARTDLALWAIAIVDIWMWTPFVMLLVLSGLSAIPDYLYEAAVIDRASSWFQFWRITVPQVAPLVLIAVLFRTIEAVKSFDLAMGLTGGGPGAATRLISIDIYTRAFLGQFKTGQASSLAVIVLVVIVAISNLYITALNKVKEG